MASKRFLALLSSYLFFSSTLFIGCIAIASAAIDPIERMEGLLLPGELVQGHARIEKKCDKCHAPFDKSKQNKLCRDCHEEIDKDIKKESNFHGKIYNIANRECYTCHTDHKGRDMDIVQLDEEMLDHNNTNFKLNGAHVITPCKSCHKKEKFYRLPKHNCIDCHEVDDSHKARMGEKCENCHVELAWLPARFNHEKTKFPLRNNHRDIACQYCHVNERYNETPKNCYFCHYLDDVHESDRGIKCHECHYDERWSRIEFDHGEDTHFKLKGSHEYLLCKDCHEGNIFEDEVKSACVSCHKVHDSHYGLYGKKCQDCHSEKKWLDIVFNHDKDTRYILKGEHKELACNTCHKGHVFEEKLPKTCGKCHVLDDTHRGQEGDKCETCHNEKSWIEKVAFDHALTKFPLHGAHPLVTCEDCHVTDRYKDTNKECDSCHEKDDIHKRKLGTQCDRCHGPEDWLVWEFDHNKQTDYVLDGAHDGLDCHACHTVKIVENKFDLATNCYSCHAKDDNHVGMLGKQCEKCHITKSFKDIVIQ